MKTRCVATSSKVPQRAKRGLEDAEVGDTTDTSRGGNPANPRDGGETVGSGDVSMETDDTKRQQTERQGRASEYAGLKL